MAAKVTREYLEDAKRYVETLNPAVTVTLDVTIAKDIAGAILDAAGAINADLIVISGYATSFRAGILLGRVPATVLCRISRTNVLVMPNRLDRYPEREELPQVLPEPLLKSSLSHGLLGVFTKSDRMRRSSRRREGDPAPPRDTGGDGKGHRTVPDPAARFKSIRDTIAHRKVKVWTIVKSGDPAREIARVAGEEDVSLIWMSIEGKGCLHEFLAGSIVQDVVMTGKRPALVIRSVE